MLKVLVIGAGTMGTAHTEAYANMENVKLAGVVDINKKKANDLADKFNTNPYKTYEEAVKECRKIDVVSICLPTPLHKEYVIKTADEGSHIICEKPLARSLNDAEEIITYCKDKNVKLFVGHVVRFFPEYAQAKQLLDENKIGNPAMIRTRRGGPFPEASKDWFSSFSSSGGLVLDMIVHDFDFLRWCFGEVERVFAKSSRNRVYGKMEYALITLRFQSGVIAHVEGSWAHKEFSTSFEMAGTEGIIEYDSKAVNPITTEINQKNGESGVAVPTSTLKENPYFTELSHFVSCIENDQGPIVTAEDAYKAMEIALAALQSIETGQPVTLNDKYEEEEVK